MGVIITKHLHEINEEVHLISGVSNNINIVHIRFEPCPLIHKSHSSHVVTCYTCIIYKQSVTNRIIMSPKATTTSCQSHIMVRWPLTPTT